MSHFRILVCRGPECGDHRGSQSLEPRIQRAIAKLRTDSDSVEVAWQSCFGRCTQGPNVLVREVTAVQTTRVQSVGLANLPITPGLTALYNRVDSERIDRIISEHIGNHRIIDEFIERPALTTRASARDSRQENND